LTTETSRTDNEADASGIADEGGVDRLTERVTLCGRGQADRLRAAPTSRGLVLRFRPTE